MYSKDQLWRGVNNPALIVQEAGRLYDRLVHKPDEWRNSRRGISFVNEDWDNLVLLDACRYDLFKANNTLNGELSAVWSNASSSNEFFQKNFDGGEFADIVYYSANPHIDKYDVELHELYRLWESEWDEELGTVLPEDAVDKVLETEEKYRDKRLVIHLMQPHRPFLGEHAANFEQPGFSAQGIQLEYGETPDIPFWWDRLESGEVSPDEVWQMYEETLQVTLPHVARLVDALPGKTVISADHGNAFGEDDIYGHPSRTHHESVLEIPWLEIDGPRKEIAAGSTTTSSNRDNFEDAEERLKALGYVE